MFNIKFRKSIVENSPALIIFIYVYMILSLVFSSKKSQRKYFNYEIFGKTNDLFVSSHKVIFLLQKKKNKSNLSIIRIFVFFFFLLTLTSEKYRQNLILFTFLRPLWLEIIVKQDPIFFFF